MNCEESFDPLFPHSLIEIQFGGQHHIKIGSSKNDWLSASPQKPVHTHMAFGQIGSVRSRFCLLSGKFLGAAEGEELPLMAIFWADYNIDSGGWHIFNECVAANNGTNLHLSPPNRIPIPKQNVLQLLPRPLLGKPLGQCVPMPQFDQFHPPKTLVLDACEFEKPNVVGFCDKTC